MAYPWANEMYEARSVQMKLGVIYPQIELNGDPLALDRYARSIEAMGYDHLLMYDHVVGAVHDGREPKLTGPYSERNPFHEPLVAFGYLAGITSRIELITGVLILPQRQTVLVAKQAAEVDLLSGGRLRLGVGSGWNYVEYDALDEDFHRRGCKMDEQIPYIRRLWSENVITYQGDFHRMDRGGILPHPRRHIPIYGGGWTEPAYRRAAKLADGFIFVLGIHEPIPAWEHMQDILREEGRSPEDFGAQFFLAANQHHRFEIPEMIEIALRLRDAGADDISIGTMERGFTTLDQHLDFLADTKERVGAALR
jgi:probable F420-dependent oxidoreductase